MSSTFPILNFSNWYRWEDRGNFPDKKLVGVYAIAITTENLEHKPFSWQPVVYIGMSNSRKGLADRWSFLDKAIRGHPKPNHSGGKTIFTTLGSYETWDKQMFVAAFTLLCNSNKDKGRTPADLREMGKVAYLEFEALAKFKENMGFEPIYNKK